MKFLKAVIRWFDTGTVSDQPIQYKNKQKKVEWVRCIPFIVMHAICLAVFWVGWSWAALGVCAALYIVRMLAITGFYHRYFSHKTFATSRPVQFCFALVGAASVQRGPLWWAAHHRHHHIQSDQPDDVHSVKQHGFQYVALDLEGYRPGSLQEGLRGSAGPSRDALPQAPVAPLGMLVSLQPLVPPGPLPPRGGA